MSSNSNTADLYKERRYQFTSLLERALPEVLDAAGMFDNVAGRTTILDAIGFLSPRRFVLPTESTADFQDRFIQELGSKLLVEITTNLLDKLKEYNVTDEAFPRLVDVRNKCLELLGEMQRRESGILDADASFEPLPAKILIEFEYGIRPYDKRGKHDLSDREELREELMDWANQNRYEDQPVFCIEAAGGLGKSMLAWSWFQEYYESHKTDGRYHSYLWWSFYGHDASFEKFVDWALIGLGVAQSFQCDEPLEKRVRLLNKLLKKGGVVMVLDGVERLSVAYLDPLEREALMSISNSGRRSSYRANPELTGGDLADEVVEEFFVDLRVATQSRFLTTSRVVLRPFIKRSRKEEKGVILRRLQPLELEYCVQLWRQINPFEVQWETVRRLCEDVGRNTLLIRVLASAVANTAGGLLDNWPKDDVATELLNTAPLEIARARLLNHALKSISKLARLALETLCAFPSPMKRELAFKLVGDAGIHSNDEELEAAFEELASWALIGIVKHGGIAISYDVHPIVRDHVRLSRNLDKSDLDENDLAVLNNIYEAVPDPGTNQVRNLDDLNWAVARFKQAVLQSLYPNAWQVFRDRLETPLTFLGEDRYIVSYLRCLFPNERLSELPLIPADRAVQGEILRLVASSVERLNEAVDVNRLWRWCLALQFLSQDSTSWIKALDSRLSLSVYAGRLKQCQDDAILALSLAKEYDIQERNYSLYCFLGISLAFQGDKERSMKAFDKAEESLSAVQESERMSSRRWVLQGRAEAMVWLGEAEGARNAVEQMHRVGSSQDVTWGQRGWEEWTAGAAAVMADCDWDLVRTRLIKSYTIAKKRHYFLVMLLSLASLARLALRRSSYDEIEHLATQIRECDPHNRCLPAQVLVNLVQAEAAQKQDLPNKMIEFAKLAYGLALEFREYREGLRQARNLLPHSLRNAYQYELAEPRESVIALLDRDEISPAIASHSAGWWESNSCISSRVKALGTFSWEETNAKIAVLRTQLQLDSLAERRRWLAQVESAYPPRDQLAILQFLRDAGLQIERIEEELQTFVKSQFSVVGYCTLLRTLGIMHECASEDSRLYRDLSVEDRRKWVESLAAGPVHSALHDYQSKPGIAFDRVRFSQALDILIEDDYDAFIDDVQRKCLQETDEDAVAWWTVLKKQLTPRDLLCFSEELVSLKLTVAEFLTGVEVNNPRSYRARLAAVSLDQLRKSRSIGFSNTSGWSQEQILARLEDVKWVLDWANTVGSAKKWWKAFENENTHRLHLVLRLAEELADRKGTITEFFLAYVYSNTDNIQANLHYLDYTRLKKLEEKQKKQAATVVLNRLHAEADAPQAGTLLADRWEGWNPDLSVSGFSNTTGWSDNRIRSMLEEMKAHLNWVNTTGGARAWWEALEDGTRERLHFVLRLAKELAVRKATITEFFQAYVYSNTDNIQAILHYLDYTRFKKGEEKRKKEAAALALQPPTGPTEPESPDEMASSAE
jgi:hypothetical protein